MGSGGKDEKMEDATAGRKGGEEVHGGGGDGKLKEKEVGQFNEGDKVLAYHGPLIYEAKIQRAEFRKKEWKYFVHYLGWSKNWDEWVGTDRLMALTDKNLETQKQLFKNQNVDKQSKGRLPQGRQRAPADTKGEREGAKINYASLVAAPKGKKRKADSIVSEEKDTDEPDHVMKIPMPAVLKKQLVDDWELIQSGKSIKLPRSPNVEDILKNYREFKTKRDSLDGDSLGEVLNGLQSYFNKALPAMLLYKQERAQYAGAVPDGSKPSLIYGAEHLLRLFVKLPELLVYTNMEEETLTQLQQKLMDFLKFLQKHQSSFFLSMYDSPKGGVRMEPEEKKLKRDSSRIEDRKDRRDVLKPIEDKREKRVGTKAVEDRREKKDAFKSSDDRKEKKESSKVVIEEKRDKKDGQRFSEEKREKKDVLKASEEKKERREGMKFLDDKKEKDNCKPSDDKKEKKDSSKSLDDKKEKDNCKPSDDKKEKKDSSKSLDDKKEKESSKSFEDKKENSKSLDDKKEESSKSVEDKKENSKSLDDKKEKESSKSVEDKKVNFKSVDGKKEKESSKSVEDNRENSKPSDDKKEKESSKSVEDLKDKENSKSFDGKKEKKEIYKLVEDQKESTKSLDDKTKNVDSSTSVDETKEKDTYKSSNDKNKVTHVSDESRDKKDTSKSRDDKQEILDTPKSAIERREIDEARGVISN